MAASLCGCSDLSDPSAATVTLQLTRVDGQALPFTVGKLSDATANTIVTGGSLSGNSIGPTCDISLAVSSGDPLTRTILTCTINPGDVISLPIDFGSGTGVHVYRFE